MRHENHRQPKRTPGTADDLQPWKHRLHPLEDRTLAVAPPAQPREDQQWRERFAYYSNLETIERKRNRFYANLSTDRRETITALAVERSCEIGKPVHVMTDDVAEILFLLDKHHGLESYQREGEGWVTAWGFHGDWPWGILVEPY